MTNQSTAKSFQSAWPTGASTATQPSFSLRGPDRAVFAYGIEQALPRGPLATMAERVSAFFARNGHGPDLIVGALPFDTTAADYLFQPHLSVSRAPAISLGATTPAQPATITDEPSSAAYSAAVATCLAQMQADPALRKVVLSRSLLIEGTSRLDPHALADQLANDASVTTFLTALPPQADAQQRTLVGATPELLVSKAGRAIQSHPLAGSAKRQPDPAADASALDDLLASDKDLREHATVVEAILDTLNPLCADLSAPRTPSGRATATMWHLGTPITGRLRSDDVTIADLVAALHPTPAVCGLPRDRAKSVIAALEAYDRQFYAGTVGWADRTGDGAWYVSIRCAELSGRSARLYAGAGIVPGSDPQAEARETSAKFLALLRAFGISEPGEAG